MPPGGAGQYSSRDVSDPPACTRILSRGCPGGSLTPRLRARCACVDFRRVCGSLRVRLSSSHGRRTIDRVRLRYHVDPATGEPHIYGHNVRENEVEEVLARPIEDRAGRDESRVAVGQTESGRYLRVIYVPDPQGNAAFVITAYDLGANALKALRRRRRRNK